MDRSPRGWLSRIGMAVGSAVSAVVASILLPTAVIIAYAVRVRDEDAIDHFALAVAEPLGALGAALATAGLAWWIARRSPGGRRLVPWIGAGAATGLIAAAIRVLDVDWWTVLAVVLMPAAALAGGIAGARKWPASKEALRSGIPSAPDQLAGGAGIDPAAAHREAGRRDPVAAPVRERGPANGKEID